MGLPCIVSNINGCNEIINDAENGIIIPSKNSQILQQKMELLLENPNGLKFTKREIRERIKNKYERQTFWKLLLAEYQSLEKNV